jgi:hypothetical protein
LIEDLVAALKDLSAAGCKKVYINGSFVTAKEIMIFAGALTALFRRN